MAKLFKNVFFPINFELINGINKAHTSRTTLNMSPLYHHNVRNYRYKIYM